MSESKAEEKPATQGTSVTIDPGTAMSPHAGAPAAPVTRDIPVVPYSRPVQAKASNESGSVVVAKALAAQLGSDPRHLAQMVIDERKVAVLNEFTATALGYFAYRSEVDHIRFWGHIVGWELVASQGIDGRGRRDILTAIANAAGIQGADVARAPNLLARNLWNKDWKEKAEKEGKIVEQ